ncbi:oligosaccharide flippase family protein [Sulfuriroseicoccus oceanibius]|uniref:Oligosaccharide flippase family protein n=1 Tax=Sulfuriroseicoccus oceanibius TaxID=2707525 RepID=A0A6B3L0R8_9BACT|nr:oligosaccharide flippase family protein [Sulfuriroseicoccus oceanibius]
MKLRYSDKLFADSHQVGSLGRKTVRGGVVIMGGQGARFVLTIGSTAALARVLTPDDFGLIGMVAVLLNFANMFKDFGLTQATIQRAQVTRQEVSNLFWVNLGVSVIIALIVCASAPLISNLYDRPEIFDITLFFGCGFSIAGGHRAASRTDDSKHELYSIGCDRSDFSFFRDLGRDLSGGVRVVVLGIGVAGFSNSVHRMHRTRFLQSLDS